MRGEWVGGAQGRPQSRAAGGVVVRDAPGEPEVAIVHRPKYRDWSLPKGKLKRWERWRQAALREVAEETGLRCEALEELPPARYIDRNGRRKLVRYWLMRALDGRFEPNREVDELRWASPGDAIELLDYEHDRELVRSVAASYGGNDADRLGKRA